MDVKSEMKRCWHTDDPLLLDYHDREWGTPVHDERLHFEFLVLEAFQAGLNWKIMLHKRENFRKALRNFQPEEIVSFTENDINRLMEDKGIVRNRKKLEAVVNNAARFLEIQEEFGSFDRYIWGFTGGETVHEECAEFSQVPVRSELSDRISNDMKKRGFRFLGSTTVQAHLQGIGIINAHLLFCSRYKELKKGS